MKNSTLNVTDKLVKKYLVKDHQKNQIKSTNINVLLNRVRTKKKNESMKKIYFSAAASAGVFYFGQIIF